MTFNHYPASWVHAMDTPFQRTKQVTSHFGGTHNALAISWPKKIKAKGEIRSQLHHVIGIMPTILEAAGLPQPAAIYGIQQPPVEGVSMIYSFNDAKAPSKHTTQYFEMLANLAQFTITAGSPSPRRRRPPPWVSVAEAVDPIDA